MARGDLVKSAQRVLEILERFESDMRPMGVSELAGRLGYPLSSTSELLNTLTRLGYLNYDASSRKFAPTMSTAMLGDWVVSKDPARSQIKGLMQDACRLTGATSVLGTRNGLDVQYIHVLRGPELNFLSRSPGAGTLRPILRSSAGIALLAGMDDRQIALIVRRVNATRGESIPLAQVMAGVQQARDNGYAWGASGVYRDVGSLSVRLPIDDVFGKPLVLTVAGAAHWVSTEHRRIAGTIRRLVGRFRRRCLPGAMGPADLRPACR